MLSAGYFPDSMNPNHLGRDSCDCAPRRHGLEHNASCGYLAKGTNLDVAEDLRACAYHHTLLNLRMAVARFLARATKGNVLED
jgi:hypothetical protein